MSITISIVNRTTPVVPAHERSKITHGLQRAGSERMGTFIVSLDANQERTITITATQTGKDTGTLYVIV